MATKNLYFIPYGQDDPVKKPNSMVARMPMLLETVEAALEGKQIQPVIVERFRDE
jgi:dipicolinate synthase subunit B